MYILCPSIMNGPSIQHLNLSCLEILNFTSVGILVIDFVYFRKYDYRETKFPFLAKI